MKTCQFCFKWRKIEDGAACELCGEWVCDECSAAHLNADLSVPRTTGDSFTLAVLIEVGE